MWVNESCSFVSDSLWSHGYPHIKRKKKKLNKNNSKWITNLNIKLKAGNSLAVQWLELHASNAEGLVQSLVGELRSHKLCWMTKNILKLNQKKKKRNRKTAKHNKENIKGYFLLSGKQRFIREDTKVQTMILKKSSIECSCTQCSVTT